MNLISLEKAAKAFAHRTLLDSISLGVSAGDRIGVVGRNGAGKSTLLGLLAGRVVPDSGRVAMAAGLRMGTFLTAGYVFQTFGLEYTSAANAGFITGLFVVLTPLVGLPLGQRPGRSAWGAALVAGIGLYLLSGAGNGAHWLGDGLELLCACAFAAHVHATASSCEKEARSSAF